MVRQALRSRVDGVSSYKAKRKWELKDMTNRLAMGGRSDAEKIAGGGGLNSPVYCCFGLGG